MFFRERELYHFHRLQPDKTNTDPWDETQTIKCSQFYDKYQDCLNMKNSNLGSKFEDKCDNLQVVALECYRLEPKYFLEVARDKMIEDYYLDMYIGKQLTQGRNPKAFKMKNQI